LLVHDGVSYDARRLVGGEWWQRLRPSIFARPGTKLQAAGALRLNGDK
jgi:hypothetical protein